MHWRTVAAKIGTLQLAQPKNAALEVYANNIKWDNKLPEGLLSVFMGNNDSKSLVRINGIGISLP